MILPHRLHMPHWPTLEGPAPAGIPSERVRALLGRLGNPERRLPPVVHVGGTKGKGSTIAFLRAMIEAGGYRVHTYTSPHLARFNERIVLAGNEISDGALHAILEETRAAAQGMEVGFFDATTAAAMLAFADHPADVLLLEMGLGGAVDATNVTDAPRLSILTTLSYDHTEYMGTTLPEIASFEAGILKPGVPCVVSYQHESVWPELDASAAKLSAPLYAYGRHWQTRRTRDGMIFADRHGEVALPPPGLLGAHQIVNAGNAIAALSALTEFEVSQEAVIDGLLGACWKGRLERLSAPALPPDSELWFDGGHNMAAGQVVAFFAAEAWADRPLYLIFGATQGKDVASILAPFASVAKGVQAVPVRSEPRSYAPAAIVNAVSGLLPIEEAADMEAALAAIAAKEEEKPFRALVFGSLYLWLEASSLAA